MTDCLSPSDYSIVKLEDPHFPANLLTIPDPPKRLWVRGTLQSQDARAIAVIGSRDCTDLGARRATRLVRELVERDFTIISGLAKGIDTAAHRAALDAGGRTIAVMGTGLLTVSPAENRPLHDRIVESGGAALSQFAPTFKGMRGGRNFLMRNVTLVGMALATVVVEASSRSGSRSAANAAILQGRPVFLLRSLCSQSWAAEMAQRPGVHVLDRVEDITELLEPQKKAAVPSGVV